MRYVASLLSGADLAVALSAPAMPQQAVPGGSPQGPLLFVLPGGGVQAVQPTPQAAQPVPQMVQPNQDRVIILAPQGGQTGQATQPGGDAAAQTGAAATQGFDLERFAHELTQRAYLQGRID